MLTRLLLLVGLLYCSGANTTNFNIGPWGLINPNTIVEGETYFPDCDMVSSGVDDNLDGSLTEDEVIVTVVICGNNDPIVRTKGK